MPIKYHLNGKEINLTSDNTIIKSTNFNVDKNGNMTCNNGTMKNVAVEGGNIKIWGNDALDGVRVFKDSLKDTKYMAYMVSDVIGVNKGNYSSAMGPDFITTGNSTMYPNQIITPSLTQTSLETQKKNFEKLQNGLDIIKNIDIYKYNLKIEDDNTKKHIGFVIGDKYKYSKEVTSNNNDGVDIYSFVAVCCKAIQEQQEQIEQQNNLIKTLIERIEKLEAK